MVWEGWQDGRDLFGRDERLPVTFAVAPPRALGKSLAGIGVYQDRGMILLSECRLHSLSGAFRGEEPGVYSELGRSLDP